ncbi:suppressor of fused domain protein [[Archangium] primigenium]|uniref:suppressor of fused domain protein n=1 Tax=Melittangium TaxID=44 RepID=UPI00195C6AC9|nr:suppressor of fused domain protein [Archangium primigenium]MBM7112100.1 suppressor of fused domain protein [Archangium primigenium]
MRAPEKDEDFVQWYEDCWADRDEVEYPKLFGAISEDVTLLEGTGALEAWIESMMEEDPSQQLAVDPNWLPMGVRVAPPSPEYPYWTYVTSGLSNPFTLAPGDEVAEDAASGIGYEMVIHTPEEERWPVLRLLDLMAYNLVCARLFAVGHRYPVDGSLTGGESKLSGFAFVTDPTRPSHFTLPSGRVQLLTLVGVTKNEMAFARSNGMPRLLERLATAGPPYITHPDRDEVKL